MFGNSRTHFVRRCFSPALVWAMAPAIVWAGVPSINCACVTCQCGARCSFDPRSGSGDTSTCRHADCSCAGTSHCCCKATLVAATVSSCPHPSESGFDKSDQGGCRSSVKLLTGIRTNIVVADDDQPLAIDLPAATVQNQARRSFDRTDALNTGPPVDLVVTLRHWII